MLSTARYNNLINAFFPIYSSSCSLIYSNDIFFLFGTATGINRMIIPTIYGNAVVSCTAIDFVSLSNVFPKRDSVVAGIAINFVPPGKDFNCIVAGVTVYSILATIPPVAFIPTFVLQCNCIVSAIAVDFMIITFINRNNVYSVAAVNSVPISSCNRDGIFFPLLALTVLPDPFTVSWSLPLVPL